MRTKITDISELKTVLIEILKEIHPHPISLRKGKIIKTYTTDDKYVADVEVLLNNDNKDETFPIIASMEIPVIIAGNGRGIIAPPDVGALCDIDFYNGDINYPRISNFRTNKEMPKVEKGEMIIANSKDSYIKIKEKGEMIIINGKDSYIKIKADNTIEVKADKVVVDSSDIKLGGDSALLGFLTQDCPCQFTGALHTNFTSKVKGE